jgi:hypothetical protein
MLEDYDHGSLALTPGISILAWSVCDAVARPAYSAMANVYTTAETVSRIVSARRRHVQTYLE